MLLDRFRENRAADITDWNEILVSRLRELAASARHYESSSMVGFFWADSGRTRRVAININADNAMHFLAELEIMSAEIRATFFAGKNFGLTG